MTDAGEMSGPRRVPSDRSSREEPAAPGHVPSHVHRRRPLRPRRLPVQPQAVARERRASCRLHLKPFFGRRRLAAELGWRGWRLGPPRLAQAYSAALRLTYAHSRGNCRTRPSGLRQEVIAGSADDIYGMYMKLAADPVTESWLIRLTGADREFDWDVGNLTKNRKHGVGPRHVHALIGGDFYFAGRIVEPVHDEPRWLALGEDATGRRLSLVFTRRGDRLRPISCRAMRRKEKALYEEARRQED